MKFNILSEVMAESFVIAIKNKLSENCHRSWEQASGKCLFKLRRSRYHADAINEIYSHISGLGPNDFKIKAGTRDCIIPIEDRFFSIYEGKYARALFYHVDCFFESAKSCLDFMLYMLSNVGLLKNPLNSMNKFCTKTLKKKNKKSEIEQMIMDAWSSWASLIKDYRDSFTHYTAMSGDHWSTAINIKWEDKLIHVAYFLPDNPKARCYSEFTFDNGYDAKACTSNNIVKLESFTRELLEVIALNLKINLHKPVKIQRIHKSMRIGNW